MLVVVLCDSDMIRAPFFLFTLCCVFQDLITEETPTRYQIRRPAPYSVQTCLVSLSRLEISTHTESRSSHDDQLSLQCLICSLGMGNIPILNFEGLI